MKAARARDLIVDGDFEGNKISRHSLERSVGRACLIKAVGARDPLVYADLYGDFPVNDVSQHARRRCRERRLPLEALSGHQRGVRTVFAPGGKVLTVMSKIQKPTFLRGVSVPGLFRDECHFGASAAGVGAAGAGADGIAARVDATGRVGHVVGKGGAKINHVCEEYGVVAIVNGNIVSIAPGRNAAAADVEGARAAIEDLRGPMRESVEVVKVDMTGYEGHVIGKSHSNLLQLQRKFDVRINIDGSAACIFPGRNAAAADVEGARGAIEAAVQAAASLRAKQEKKAERRATHNAAVLGSTQREAGTSNVEGARAAIEDQVRERVAIEDLMCESALDSHAERADSDAVKRVRGEWCAGRGLLSVLPPAHRFAMRIAKRCGRQGKAKEYSHFA